MVNTRIRVGILILSNLWGGAEESVYKIANFSDKKKLDIHLLVNEFLYEKYREIENVTVLNLGKLESNKKLQKIYSLYKINSKLIEFTRKYGLAIIHAQLENTILVLGMSYQKLSVPIIFSLRGTETQIYHNPQTLEQRIIRYIMDKLFEDRRVSFTAVTKWLLKDYKINYRSKTKILYNGVDLKKFHNLDLKRDKKTVLFVGRYIERKGIEELLKVAANLKDLNFLFAGKGPLKPLISLSNTKDLGFIERDDLVNLYNQATVCVFPSRFEAFGNVSLEAMSCGAPVIVTNSGFIEYVDNGVDGLIIEPGNIEQLEDSIVKLMKNPKLRNYLGKNARRKAIKYDVRNTIKKYEELYMNAAQSRMVV